MKKKKKKENQSTALSSSKLKFSRQWYFNLGGKARDLPPFPWDTGICSFWHDQIIIIKNKCQTRMHKLFYFPLPSWKQTFYYCYNWSKLQSRYWCFSFCSCPFSTLMNILLYSNKTSHFKKILRYRKNHLVHIYTYLDAYEYKKMKAW